MSSDIGVKIIGIEALCEHFGKERSTYKEKARALRAKLQQAYADKSGINTKLQQAYSEKSEINAKLQQVYAEKSEINMKLHQTYAEKSDISAKLKTAYQEKMERGKQIKILEARIAELNEELQEEKARNSITKVVKNILKRIKNIFVGFLVKEYQEKLHPFDRPSLAVLAFLIFVVIGRYNSANMGKNEYRYPFSFVFGALLASYCLISTSRLIQDSSIRLVRLMKRDLCYLGKKSIDIVIWQFVAFRLVIVLQLWMNGEPISDLLLYYPVYSASNGWWIVYTIVGCAVPIWWGNMYHGMWRAVKAAARKLSVS